MREVTLGYLLQKVCVYSSAVTWLLKKWLSKTFKWYITKIISVVLVFTLYQTISLFLGSQYVHIYHNNKEIISNYGTIIIMVLSTFVFCKV